MSGKDNEVIKLKEKIIDVQNVNKLGFRNFVLCSNIVSFGQYVPVESNKVIAGSKLLFYYEPCNLFTNRKDGNYQIWYTQDMILFNNAGGEIYRQDNALNFNYQTFSPVLDVYATNSLELRDLAPGEYTFNAVMHDKLKNVSAKYKYDFEVI